MARPHCVGGQDTGGGSFRTQAAAFYPPALCTNILRGIAAQRAREGRPMPKVVEKRLEEGRAVFNLEALEAPQGCSLPGCRQPAASAAHTPFDSRADL